MRPHALRFVLRAALAVVGALGVQPAYATGFFDILTHTNSATSVAGHLCRHYGDTDLGCPTEAPYLTSGGLLGVGISNPQYPLDVSGTVRATQFIGDGSGLTGVIASTGDRIVSSTTSMIADGASGLISITQAGTNTAYFHPQLGLVTVGVSSTGTVSASGLYSSYAVVGTARPSWLTSGVYSGGHVYTVGNMVVGASSLVGANAGNYYFGDSNVMTGFRGYSVVGGNNYIAALISNTEAMRIVSSGYVGIGTSAPSAKLEVAGTISASTVTATNVYGAAASLSTVTAGTASIGSLGVGNLAASGNITAANISASANVSVTGNLTAADIKANELSATNVYGSAASFTTINGGTFNGTFVGDGSGLTGVIASTGDRIVSSTTSMIADGASGLISITQAGTNTAYFHPQLGLVTVGVSSTGGISGTTGYFSGNVGIKTAANSSYDLSIGSNAYAGGIIYAGSGFRATSTNTPALSFGTGSVYVSGSSANGYLALGTSNTEAMRIVSSGYVGIGTSTPRRALSVGSYLDFYSGASNQSGVPSIRGSSSLNLMLNSGGSGTVYLNNDSGTGGVYFGNGSGGVAGYWSAAGQVGVGVSVPSSSLHVSGTTRITSWTMVNANATPTVPLEVSGAVKISGDGTEGCSSAADAGKIRLNPTTQRFQLCRHYN